MVEHMNLVLVFAAGLASVLSPCVLPVLPVILAGSGNESRLRPVAVVAGLAFTFMLMGIASSLFGSFIGTKIYYIEKAGALLIIILGILLAININPFKQLHFLSRFAQKSRGLIGGFLLGFTLGIIWIPCVGPILSSVLTMVASSGQVPTGIFLLFVYSLGFAVPMLIAGYASHFFRSKISRIGRHPHIISIVSGLLLIVLGCFILIRGMVGFGL